MNKTIRILLAFAFVGGLAVLARNQVAWAGGAARGSNQAASATLTGFIWNDGNHDGIQDVAEKGVPDVVVKLYDSTRTLVNTVITDANGHYRFESLAPGDYYVALDTLTGFVISPENNGKNEKLDSDANVVTGATSTATLVAGENSMKWDIGLSTSARSAASDPGTVKPPPGEITICKDGVHLVGGVSTLEVKILAPGYCVVAFLRNHAFAVGRIPDGAGNVLAHITFVRIFYQGKLISALPVKDGTVQLCYAVPPGKTAQLYFFDFYGPRLHGGKGQPSWTALQTTVDGGKACSGAQETGAYAIIGQ